MYGGYLIIETNSDKPGLVRIRDADSPPSVSDAGHRRGPLVRYAARFEDLSAAHMHAHAQLRHFLVDAEAGLYRTDPVIAIAAVESIDLRHRQIYLDSSLAADPQLGDITKKKRLLHRFADRIWQAVGVAAILFLLVKLLLGF